MKTAIAILWLVTEFFLIFIGAVFCGQWLLSEVFAPTNTSRFLLLFLAPTALGFTGLLMNFNPLYSWPLQLTSRYGYSKRVVAELHQTTNKPTVPTGEQPQPK